MCSNIRCSVPFCFYSSLICYRMKTNNLFSKPQICWLIMTMLCWYLSRTQWTKLTILRELNMGWQWMMCWQNLFVKILRDFSKSNWFWALLKTRIIWKRKIYLTVWSIVSWRWYDTIVILIGSLRYKHSWTSIHFTLCISQILLQNSWRSS